MLKIDELAKYINVDDIPEDWVVYYDVALLNFREDWLNYEEFRNILNFYNFEVDLKEVFEDVWHLVYNDENLSFLVYLWYYILYEVKMDKRNKWNTKLSYFKNHGSLYMPMVAFLMGYKYHQEIMENYDLEQVNIQKKIIREICLADYKNYDIWGMRFSSMEWGSRFIRGQIVQIGILQYEYKKNFGDTEDVIFIHIPRIKLFNKENIDYSLINRDKVFSYFERKRDIKFVCESWLLSPDVKNILDINSSILYFQSFFNIVKVKENNSDFLKFVFNDPLEIKDYNCLDENTRLQKVLKSKLLNNEKLRIGLGILK